MRNAASRAHITPVHRFESERCGVELAIEVQVGKAFGQPAQRSAAAADAPGFSLGLAFTA